MLIRGKLLNYVLSVLNDEFSEVGVGGAPAQATFRRAYLLSPVVDEDMFTGVSRGVRELLEQHHPRLSPV